MTVIFESDCNRLRVFSALTGHEGDGAAEEVEAGRFRADLPEVEGWRWGGGAAPGGGGGGPQP